MTAASASHPVISVIVPCFKQAHFLPDCLGSLQRQTLSQWEMVIVDDGSPDDAITVAEALMRDDPRVRLVKRPNGGPSAARNTGVMSSRGRYLQFLDADDLLVPTKLQRHCTILDARPDLGLVYGNAWYFNHDNQEHRVRSGFRQDPNEDWIANRATGQQKLLHRVISYNLMPICSPLFRRTLFDAAGPMDESMRAVEDWEFWIRCASTGASFQFDSSPEGEALIRLHPTSASQDRKFMADAELGMRLRCMTYLQDRRARRLMLHLIGRALAVRAHVRRDEFYDELRGTAIGAEEQLAVWIGKRFGPQTAWHSALIPVLRRLPWHMRSLACGLGARQSQAE